MIDVLVCSCSDKEPVLDLPLGALKQSSHQDPLSLSYKQRMFDYQGLRVSSTLRIADELFSQIVFLKTGGVKRIV